MLNGRRVLQVVQMLIIVPPMPKRGQVRADGRIFWSMDRGRERWLSPIAFIETKARLAETRHSLYLRNSAEEKRRFAEWRENNREKENATTRSRYDRDPSAASAYKHRRRKNLRHRGHAVTPTEIRALASRSAGICHYCRQPAKLTLDHIVPISRGGPHHIHNLAMACKSCNSSKGSRWPEEFLLQRQTKI